MRWWNIFRRREPAPGSRWGSSNGLVATVVSVEDSIVVYTIDYGLLRWTLGLSTFRSVYSKEVRP